jgi:hypothetical protein
MTNKNSLRFNRHTTIETEKEELHIKAIRRMRHAVMLLFLHRLPRKAAMFCTFKKIWEPMKPKTRHYEE